ncbi:LysR substrate-binding domain-containing protein [Devosia rhodophyticola]|uniref:LysR substrate-binding domain-containing protein n=1 Tax=Devosia rhodophyticola TaxID=3026423 RepID=A0ABY7YZJ3_9HYPH|nr:LysR substrate-binding domain-containing protein [Devosia rhodophyticola]WDR06798.1 LysR substrate-binding domain-containing protein [Devosia rhodophyticola]
MQQFDSVTARLIMVLAETGSIGRAAERESIASSAVSRRVSDLESRLGVVLFDRSAQGVRLTAAGQIYAERCRNVLREIAALDTVMADFATGQRGSLRLACTSSALSGRLPELLALYADKNPTIALEIQETSASKGLAALDDGRCDIAIVSDNYDFSRFEIKPFEDDHVWVVVSPDHPLASTIAEQRQIGFDQLLCYEMVGIHQTGALDRLLAEAARKAGRTLGERVRVESFPALVRMVEAGFGIGFLRSTSLHLVAGTDLLAAPLAEPWARRQLLVAQRRNSPLSAAMKLFLTLCVQTYLPSP